MSWYSRQLKQSSKKSLKNQISDLAVVNLEIISGHASDLKVLFKKAKDPEAWMVDKIATARNDLHDVRMHLMQG